MKFNPLPGGFDPAQTQVSLEKCHGSTNLGRTLVSFDFGHAHLCLHTSNFAALGKLHMPVKN